MRQKPDNGRNTSKVTSGGMIGIPDAVVRGEYCGLDRTQSSTAGYA
jgi:hypothetical protein